MAVDKKQKWANVNIFLPVLVIHFNLGKQSIHRNQLRHCGQFVYVWKKLPVEAHPKQKH